MPPMAISLTPVRLLALLLTCLLAGYEFPYDGAQCVFIYNGNKGHHTQHAFVRSCSQSCPLSHLLSHTLSHLV